MPDRPQSAGREAALRFVNARVLGSDGVHGEPLTLAHGRIAAQGDGRVVDASGLLILPGIVDLHGDAFERHLAPRRGALRSLGDGLRAVETEMAANGVTTGWLAQFWSWEGGMRGPDFAHSLCAALAQYDPRLDMRVQLRFDIACHADHARLGALFARYGIDYLVFNDRLPHAALAAGKRPPRLDGQALRAGRSPADHLTLMQRLSAAIPDARTMREAIARLPAGVRIGSHDDATPESRRDNRALGARIAEFPLTAAAASAAREAGDAVIFGAPNVVRGGSHGKGVSARDMIEAGLCDALASDYHYPSLSRAAFAMMDEGWSLADAWALVSASPAAVMGLNDRGRIAQGKRADLVIIDEASRRIVGTLVAGHFVYASEPLISRLIRAG